MTSLFSTPKAPPAPDPTQLANAQGAANAETARVQAALNRVNEVNPDGNVNWTNNGGDQWTRTVTLSPDQQRALDAERALDASTNELALGQVGRISDAVSSPFSFDGLPAAPSANDDARRRVEDALFGRATRFLDSDTARGEEALRTRLANQGITQGSDAYTAEMENFNRTRDAAYADARDSAIAAGGQEQSRLFGLEDAARQRAIGERVQLRAQPINEIAALLGTGQVQAYQPGAIPQVGVAPTDVIGANTLAYNANMNTYNQRMGARNALIGALAGTAGSAAGGYFGG